MPDIGLRDALHIFVEEHAAYTRYQWYVFITNMVSVRPVIDIWRYESVSDHGLEKLHDHMHW